MKKFFTLFLLTVSLISMAQESTLLRLIYNKGDKYIMSMEMNQNMAVMDMIMKMEMSMDVIDVKDDVYNTEMKIKNVSIDMISSQDGMNMYYDSNKSDDELDEMGKQMKMQFAPMLEMVIFAKTNNLGEVLETRIEPYIPNTEQFTNQSSGVVYPKNEVKVGDTWSIEKDSQGMKMNFIYTVNSITKDVVLLDLSGKISSPAEGTISGNMEIDRANGLPIKSTILMDMVVLGQKTKSSINVVMKKL
ncbi:hypothetical protein JYT89_00770 [Flavobacteriaceae bacterium AH-315-B10]|nr:hypothetical protein [Flavobacteriaceae bacterium AH-315-B10]